MRFQIVVPTIRLPKCSKNMERLAASITVPTDLIIATGEEGKSQTLNRHLRNMPNDVGWLATIDDDVGLYRGWQDDIIQAFAAWPEFGAFGLDLSHTEEGRSYMQAAASCQVLERHRIHIRPCTGVINIGGCILVMPANVARAVGEYPYCDDRKYQPDEDGWRCHRITAGMKMQIGYVVTQAGQVDFTHSEDSPEYLAERNKCLTRPQQW